MNEIFVVGHRNPDTDSIVAAMSYAALRNALGDREYTAACLGHISDETQRMLDKFGFEPPRQINDVRTQVRDLDFDTPPALNSSVTMNRAWRMMREQKVSVIPVINEDGTLHGTLSAGDIASYSLLTIIDPHIDDVPLYNVLSVLEGKILNEDAELFDCISGNVALKQCLADIVCRILGQILGGHECDPNCEGLVVLLNAVVGAAGNDSVNIEREAFGKLCYLFVAEVDELDLVGGFKVGEEACRCGGIYDDSVNCAVAECFGGLCKGEVLGLDILLDVHAEGLEDDLIGGENAAAGRADGDLLASEVFKGVDIGILEGYDLNNIGVHRCKHLKGNRRGECAGAVESVEGNIELNNAHFNLAVSHEGNILDRACRDFADSVDAELLGEKVSICRTEDVEGTGGAGAAYREVGDLLVVLSAATYKAYAQKGNSQKYAAQFFEFLHGFLLFSFLFYSPIGRLE